VRLGLTIALLSGAVAAALPAAALAAPPSNDNRANAQVISLPANVDGTTVEATREANETESGCTTEGGTVWYRVNADQAGRVIVGLNANGDLDAVVDVFRARRSQLDFTDCEVTDDDGRAQLDFEVERGEVYLIRVAPLENSVQDTFRLTVQLGEPAAEPPGRPLARKGSTGTLHGVLNPSDAYAFRMRAGVTYRLNLASSTCTNLLIYAPGTGDFDEDSPEKRTGCGGYTLFTPGPGETGVYSLLASAGPRRGDIRYRLSAGRAGQDDLSPGRLIRNRGRAKGSLNANRLDVRDLYRFDIERRSNVTLRLNTGAEFFVVLLRPNGKRISSGAENDEIRLGRGRYYAQVRARRGARGSYTLRRISKTITRTGLTVNGRTRSTVAPGATAAVAVRVRPGSAGPVAITVERFDPVEGWQFLRTYRRRAGSTGDATVAFRAPSVGRWRFRAEYRGTRRASASTTGYAFLKAQTPIDE
jgi:hypothetical protein